MKKSKILLTVVTIVLFPLMLCAGFYYLQGKQMITPDFFIR